MPSYIGVRQPDRRDLDRADLDSWLGGAVLGRWRLGDRAARRRGRRRAAPTVRRWSSSTACVVDGGAAVGAVRRGRPCSSSSARHASWSAPRRRRGVREWRRRRAAATRREQAHRQRRGRRRRDACGAVCRAGHGCDGQRAEPWATTAARRALALVDAGRDADAVVAGAGDERAPAGQRGVDRGQPLRGGGVGTAGRRRASARSRTAVGCTSSADVPADLVDGVAHDGVVVEVVGRAAVASRARRAAPRRRRRASGPTSASRTRPPSRGPGTGFGHEVAAAAAAGARASRGTASVTRTTAAWSIVASRRGGSGAASRRAAAPSARPGWRAPRRRTRSPSTRQRGAVGGATVHRRADRSRSSRPLDVAAVGARRRRASAMPRRRRVEDRTGRPSARRPRTARAPSSRLRPRPASAASCGTIARLEAVGVGGVDAADERVDEALVDLVAEAGPHERADRVAGGRVRGSSGSSAARALPRHVSRRLREPGAACRRARRAGGPRGSGAGRRATPPPWRRSATSGRRRARRRGRARWRAGRGRGTRRRPRRRRRARRTATCAILPPRRSSASRSSIDGVGQRRGQRVGGRQPGDAAADDEDAGHPASGDDAIGERAEDRRVGVHRAPCGRTASPAAAARRARLDVEVVEHLEVVGHEAARAHEQPVGAAAGELVDDGEDVGPEPRFGRAAGATASRSTTVVVEARAGRRRPSAVGAQLVRVRVAGGEDALRQRVGREHARASPAAASASRR